MGFRGERGEGLALDIWFTVGYIAVLYQCGEARGGDIAVELE